MARLFADEDFDFHVTEALRALGFDVLTTLEAGLANRGILDMEILAAATRAGRAVLTHNRHHFVQLHKRGTPHAGILVVSRDVDPDAVARRIEQTIGGRADLSGELLRVNRPA